MSLDEFAAIARSQGLDPAVAGVLYEVLTASFRVRGLELEADLYGRYGIVDDELDEVVAEGARLLGRVLPTYEHTLAMPPVRTVADLVRFLQDM